MSAATSGDEKTCFVVMGFGEKTDFETGRRLDLDKTYRIIIKPAVEQAGLTCIRADDIVHSGVIDQHMYEQLLNADVVIADVSTSNLNAVYELGVRHALRPHTTIIIAESEFKYPFDIKSLVIRHYRHLGAGIDAEDADQAKAILVDALLKLTDEMEPDSPVYTFIPGLNAPTVGEVAEVVAALTDDRSEGSNVEDASVAVLMETFAAARAREDWMTAKAMLNSIQALKPGDPFVTQQLALATYKSKQPDAESSLFEAKGILTELNPEISNDPETLGIWGAIHKRLWDARGDRDFLDEAVRAYGKGFYLKDDWYNGINYAFMLDVRAAESVGDDAIADHVWARRTRERVIELAQAELQAEKKTSAGEPLEPAVHFWRQATLAEAYAGTGRPDEAEAHRSAAAETAPESWMLASLETQLETLRRLIQ
jgi:tetratricopeptide (TPR) repeat protein